MVKKMNKKSFKILIVSVIIVLIGLAIYLIISSVLKKEKEYTHLKKYSANEYIPTYVSSEDMAKIYLNDYSYYMKYDQDKAYNLLDENYKNTKFSSFNDFRNYINKIVNSKLKLVKYSKYSKKGYIMYKLY